MNITFRQDELFVLISMTFFIHTSCQAKKLQCFFILSQVIFIWNLDIEIKTRGFSYSFMLEGLMTEVFGSWNMDKNGWCGEGKGVNNMCFVRNFS